MATNKLPRVLEQAQFAATANGEALDEEELEALRSICEVVFEEGYAVAEKDNFKRLSPNPYVKVTS